MKHFESMDNNVEVSSVMFHGKEFKLYTVVCYDYEYTLAPFALLNELFDKNTHKYVSPKAKAIDNGIAYYLLPEEERGLTYARCYDLLGFNEERRSNA